VIKGLVYIVSDHRTLPVLIAANTFDTNTAYFDTIGIFIRARAQSVASTTTIDPSSQSDLQCGGYLI
jgi:hypothetical protein